MKTFVRLIRRYVLAAVGIVLLLVFLGLGLLVFLGWQETTHLPQRTYASSEIADAMVETPAGLALGAAHTPEEWMDGYAWAMVLDDTGHIRWSYALPDALNHAYTTGEVAGFARWYLDDYPVFCWAEDYGLFVIGLARGSLWKCSIYTSPEYILSLAKTIPLGFGLLLLLAAICCFLLSWQGAKRLETVASGLDALAEGQTVQLPTEGFAGELAEKLNRTSAQLQTRNELLARRDDARTSWIAGVSHDVRTPLALILGCGWAAWYTHRKGKVVWNIILLSTTMVLVGFSSYASVTIRAAANPPMNSNNPNNPHALLSMLNRDQYGDRPLLLGAYYSAPPEGYKEKSFYYLDEDGKYKPASVITGYTHSPEFVHFFPRMWDARKGEKEYKQWGAYRTRTDVMRDDKGEILRDEQGRPIRGEVVDFGRKKLYNDGYEDRTIVEPTFAENLNFFFNYQLSYMYWRYFLWNFVGRQSDIQPTRTQITDGNWLSGIKWIDEKFLGPQDDLPREIAENKGRNTYYFLPFLLGLIGLIYQLNRDERNFSIVLWLFIMTGIALVFYFNTSPGEPRERDYVYAGSFYAFCIWIGFGVLAIRDLVAWLTRRNNVTAAVAATVVCMGVPTILAAQNWDDHDRSHRYMARDIGWNYLMSTLPNSIILNYGDNDTFPLWNNQEIYGVRPDVRIMNTSYLGGEWYIDEMKTKANDAPGVPFSLPKSKYTFTNDWVPVDNRFDRAVDIKDVIEFVRSEDPRSKIKLSDGTMTDYIPTKRIALPVNKENAIASGIVAEKDRAQMVDTVYINLRKNSIDKTQLMILDMLANFDWKRPLYMTQVYILQDFGLMDYLQFDGYAYRFVPILTPVQNPWEIGRIDADYAAPLLKETFRYGNLADPRVYADYFIQYNLSASHARDAFARVAKELLRQDRAQEAVELLDMGLEKLPPSQIRFTDSNTYPFLEAYYAASAMGVEDAADKGDALLREYARTLIEYIEYYLRFDGVQGDMVSPIIDEKLDQLGDVYYLAVYAGRKEIIGEINAYYRSLGVEEENLVDVGDKPHQVDTTLIPRKDTAQ